MLQPKLTRSRRLAVDMARGYLRMSPDRQRIHLGDDYQRKIDSLAVFVAAYDYAVAARARRVALPAQPAVVALLAVPDKDSWLADVAPSIELVLEMRFALMSLDVDALDPMDAVDVLKELQWCDFWYDWHARQFDA